MSLLVVDDLSWSIACLFPAMFITALANIQEAAAPSSAASGEAAGGADAAAAGGAETEAAGGAGGEAAGGAGGAGGAEAAAAGGAGGEAARGAEPGRKHKHKHRHHAKVSEFLSILVSS